jgi:hypothetical protein
MSEPVDAEFRSVPSEQDLRAIEHNKDPEAMRCKYFAVVKGIPLEQEAPRHDFIARHFEGIDSLATAIDLLEPDLYSELVDKAADEAAEWRKEAVRQAQLETVQGWHPSMNGILAQHFVAMVRAAELHRTEVYPFVSMIIGRHVFDRAQVEQDDVLKVLAETGVVFEDGDYEPRPSEDQGAAFPVRRLAHFG